MPNITETEWSKELVKLSHKLEAMPYVNRVDVHRSSLDAVSDGDYVAGAVELRTGAALEPPKRPFSTIPAVVLTSSSTLQPGTDLAVAIYQLNVVRGLVDALLVARADLCGLVVYADGECPCDECKFWGDRRDPSKCKSCGGKGVR